MTNAYLRDLQEDIQLALADDTISAGQIVEIVRETIKIEADKARAAARKAQEALEKLNTNATYSTWNPTAAFTNQRSPYVGADSITFGANDGIAGGIAEDILSL